jgi:hypothetical protein
MKRLAAGLVIASLFMIGCGDAKTTKTKTEAGKTPVTSTVEKTADKTK